MRVLVVEDEPLVGDVLHDSLTHLGHQPSVVHTAEDALVRLADERPDVILLDMRLPGMSGSDFLQLRPIREFGVPIVALSGVASDTEIRDCLRHGALDFMPKPVSMARLHQVLTYAGARSRRATVPDGSARDRRRAARAAVEMAVLILEDGGARWEGVSVDLSAYGMKVRANAPGGIGSTVTLVFAPPDDGPPVRTRALVLRHVDGYAFYFVGLADESFRRLAAFVQDLLTRPDVRAARSEAASSDGAP